MVAGWNVKANAVGVAAKLPPPPAYRAMAMARTAVYEALNAITKRYVPGRLKLDAAVDASVDAAVAAANRTLFLKLVPSQEAVIESDYEDAASKAPQPIR